MPNKPTLKKTWELTERQKTDFEDMKRFMSENIKRIEMEVRANIKARVRYSYNKLNQKQNEN